MQIAILLFDRLTALDAVSPYEVLSRIPGTEVVFAGERTGPVRNDVGSLGLVADATLAEVSGPDIVSCPAGLGRRHTCPTARSTSGCAPSTRSARGRHRCAPAR